MSLISEVKSFAGWAEGELAKLFKAEPKIEQIADTVLKYGGAALQVAVTAEGGAAAGAEVGKIISTAQTDLTVANGLITDYGATPTAASLVSSIQANLQPLLGATGVKNPTSQSAVTNTITNLGLLATALTTAAAGAAPAATTE